LGRDFHIAYLGKILICVWIQTVSKKLADIPAAKLVGRQTNIVNHQQTDISHIWPNVHIGGWHFRGWAQPAVFYLH